MAIEKIIVYVERQYSPQAVLDYTRIRGGRNVGSRMKGDGDLVPQVKKHLASVGWIFYYQKKNDGRELRYESPNGKKFYSLMTACKWYVAKGCLHVKADCQNSASPVHIESCVDAKRKLERKSVRSGNKNGSMLFDSLDETKKRKFVEDDVSVRVQPSTKRPRKVKRNMLSRLFDRNLVLQGAIVDYRNKKDGLSMKQGRMSRQGVVCSCCGFVFSLSKFEAHAGSTKHWPAAHLFLEDGRSIDECLNREKRLEKLRSDHESLDAEKTVESARSEKEPDNESDIICSVCCYEGNLILCDQCPSAFHTKCLGLSDVPQGDWFCPSCCCIVCNFVSAKHYKEQPREDGYLQCGQCEHRYHIGCLRSSGLIRPDYQPEEGNWFCNSRCKSIHLALQNLLGKPNPVGHDDLTWTLLKYKHNNAPNNGKLRAALSIMHECFEPVREVSNRRDILKDAIFNKWSALHRLNFQGFCTMALGRKDRLFTVALVRIHGEKVAEIPFVATRFKHRQLGMCRILMNELEKKLMDLGVERLVLPAAPYVLDTWENKFGFSRMNESERLNFLGCTFLDFPGTIMCQKSLINIPSDIREEEHVYDHIDNNFILDAFEEDQRTGSDDVSQSPEQQHIDPMVWTEDAKVAETSNMRDPWLTRPPVFKFYERRKLGPDGKRERHVCVF